MINQAHHHHHQGQKADHTRRQLLTHKAPLEPAEPYTKFLHGGEGLVGPPLPRLHGKKVPAIELLLYGWHYQNKSTAKEKQI